MAKQSDKTPMTLIACKMLSWPYGTIKSQQMKVQIVIYEKSTKVKIFTLCTRSKFRLVEHSTIIRNGKIQHQLLNQEYSFTIAQRLSSTTHRKDRAVFTQNALENPLLSQPRHDLVHHGNVRLQINQEPVSH